MEEPGLLQRARASVAQLFKSVGYAWLLLLLILPFLVFVYMKSTMAPYSQQGQQAPTRGWGGLLIDYVSLQWWAIISSALFFGALGHPKRSRYANACANRAETQAPARAHSDGGGRRSDEPALPGRHRAGV